MMPRSDASLTSRFQVSEVHDDSSSLGSAQMAELEAFEDDLSFNSDLDDDSDSDFEAEFLLDIGVLESDGIYRNERRRGTRRCLEEEEDPLETDSLQLIRRRVPHVQQDQLSAVEDTSPMSPSIVKKIDGSLPFQVCEVPLGVALKDIIPSSLFLRQNFQFPELHTRSESLLDGIDKALEILSI